MLVETRFSHERVVVGDGVGFAVFPTVDVDAQDSTQEVLGDVLAVAATVSRIPVFSVAGAHVSGTAAVAEREIEIAVGTERDRAAVVDLPWLVHLQKDPFGVRLGGRAVVARGELREHLGVGVRLGRTVCERGAVAQEKPAVRREVGMEGDSKQTALGGEFREAVGHVDERFVLPSIVLDGVHLSGQVNDEPAVVAGRDGEIRRHLKSAGDLAECDGRSLRDGITSTRGRRRRGPGFRVGSERDCPAHRAAVWFADVLGHRLARGELECLGRALLAHHRRALDDVPVSVEQREVVSEPVEVRPRDPVGLPGFEVQRGIGLAGDARRAPPPAGDFAAEFDALCTLCAAARPRARRCHACARQRTGDGRAEKPAAGRERASRSGFVCISGHLFGVGFATDARSVKPCEAGGRSRR